LNRKAHPYLDAVTETAELNQGDHHKQKFPSYGKMYHLWRAYFFTMTL